MEIKLNKVVATTGEIPYTTKITSGSHFVIADEPADHGGADSGMKPHDLLLAALASCTGITIKMYANRKGWNLKNVNINATLERRMESGIQTTTAVQYVLLEGDLDAEMKNRLLEIGSR